MEITKPSGQHFSMDVALAAAYGVNEAFLIHHFQHWIRVNRDRGANFREGRTWTYQTYQEIADHFPFLDYEQVKYAIGKLVKDGVILKGNFNKSAIDTTNWYCFVDEEIFVPVISRKSKNVYERENSPSDRENSPSMGNFPSSIPDTQTPDALPVVVVAGARGQAANSDITYMNCKGQSRTVTESEVYRKFLKNPEFNAVLPQAMQITRETKSGINEIYRFIEGICRNLLTEKSKEPKILPEPPKQEDFKQKMIEPNNPVLLSLVEAARKRREEHGIL